MDSILGSEKSDEQTRQDSYSHGEILERWEQVINKRIYNSNQCYQEIKALGKCYGGSGYFKLEGHQRLLGQVTFDLRFRW